MECVWWMALIPMCTAVWLYVSWSSLIKAHIGLPKNGTPVSIFAPCKQFRQSQVWNYNNNKMTELRQHTIHVHMDQTCPRFNSHRILHPIQPDRYRVCPIVHHCRICIYTINVCWFCHTHNQSSTPFRWYVQCCQRPLFSNSLYPFLCDGVHVLSIFAFFSSPRKELYVYQPFTIHRQDTDQKNPRNDTGPALSIYVV